MRRKAEAIRNVSVAAMSETLADELGSHGINVVVVHPGPTRTEGTLRHIQSIAKANVGRGCWRSMANNAIGRMVDASEVADVVAFLASPRSVEISGDSIVVGGAALGTIYY